MVFVRCSIENTNLHGMFSDATLANGQRTADAIQERSGAILAEMRIDGVPGRRLTKWDLLPVSLVYLLNGG